MIRSEFTNRIATQIGVEPKAFQKTVEANPGVFNSTPSESYEAVELGLEKAISFAASPDKNASSAAALRKENPKAYDAANQLLDVTSYSANEKLEPSAFKSFGDGIMALQVTGPSVNGTLWIDTTPGENGIESMLLRNDKCHGPNPCIAPPPPRKGEVTNDTRVDSHVFEPVSQELGADKVFSGLDDPKLTRFTDWALGRSDLPFGSPLDALPQGWKELSNLESGHIGDGDNYILGSPWQDHQIVAVDTKAGQVTLLTQHNYRRPTDFEGSHDQLVLTRYKDGEVRRDYSEMHD